MLVRLSLQVNAKLMFLSQMSALSVIGANLMNSAIVPVTKDTGGTSKSDPNAGSDSSTNPVAKVGKITTSDKAGAAILTILVICGVIGGSLWIIV